MLSKHVAHFVSNSIGFAQYFGNCRSRNDFISNSLFCERGRYSLQPGTVEPFRTSAPKYDSRASLTAKVETLLSTVSFGYFLIVSSGTANGWDSWCSWEGWDGGIGWDG